MKKNLVLGVLILLGLFGLYINRSYAYIYDTIKAMNLRFTDTQQVYLVSAESFMIRPNRVKYTVVGDSLSYGVGADTYDQSFPYAAALVLSQKDNAQVTLIDRSFPGYRTKDILEKVVDKAVADNPDYITLLIGVNDVHGNILPSTFQERFGKILNRLATETKAKIFVINLPYLGSSYLIFPPWNYYFDWQTNWYNNIIDGELAKYPASRGITKIDLYTPTNEIFKSSGTQYSKDQFHPSTEGYKLWVSVINAEISR